MAAMASLLPAVARLPAVAALGRLPVGRPGAGPGHHPVRRLPVGAARVRPDRVAVHAVRRLGWSAAGDLRHRPVRRPARPGAAALGQPRRGRRCAARGRGGPSAGVGDPPADRADPRPPQRWSRVASPRPVWASSANVRRSCATTSTPPISSPPTSRRAGSRALTSSSGRRTPRTSTRSSDPEAFDLIEGAVDAVGVPVLVGAVLDGPGPDYVSNTGIVWSPETGPGERYVKRHPVPFGEYIPFRDQLSGLIARLDQIPRDFAAGSRPGVLDVGPTRVGDVICFEIAYDGIVRDVVDGGAKVLVVQTNNATYNGTGQPEQQLAMSRLRAIEHGRAVLVAATSGISAVVLPGRSRAGPVGRADDRDHRGRRPAAHVAHARQPAGCRARVGARGARSRGRCSRHRGCPPRPEPHRDGASRGAGRTGAPAGAGHRADVQREGQRRARRRPAACGRPRRRRPRRRRRQPGRDRRPGRRSRGDGPPDPGDAPVEQAGTRRGVRGRVRLGTGARLRRAGRDGRRRLAPARAAARPAGCPVGGRPGARLAVGARRATSSTGR